MKRSGTLSRTTVGIALGVVGAIIMLSLLVFSMAGLGWLFGIGAAMVVLGLVLTAVAKDETRQRHLYK
jgi:hypothetical protein